MCKKKSKLYCPCKRRKIEVACKERNLSDPPHGLKLIIGNESLKLECDEECHQTKSKSRLIEASKDEKRRELEERLAREEAQKFEKLMTEGGHRKRKNRRRMSQEIAPSFLQKHKLMLSAVLIVGLLSIVIGVFLKRE